MSSGPWGKHSPDGPPNVGHITEAQQLQEISRCAVTIRREVRSYYNTDFPGRRWIDLFTESENTDPKRATILYMTWQEKKDSPASLNKLEQIVRSAAALHESALKRVGYEVRVERIQEDTSGEVKTSNNVFLTFEKKRQ